MNSKALVSNELTRKIIYHIGPLMVIMYIFNQIHRANVGYASLQMNPDLGLTAAQFGLATSFFYIGYILFEVPSNLIMHRVGARIWIARILITWGIASSLTGFVPNKEWLWAARFILGVFEAGLFPGLVFYMTLWLPTRNRVLLMSIFVMAIPITGTLGAPISTLIMQHVSLFDLAGWRSMLILEGIPALVLGFWVLARFPDSPDKAKWLTPDELAQVKAALEAERAEVPEDSKHLKVREIFTSGKIWALGLVYFSINTGIICLLYFFPQVVKSMEAAYQTTYSIVEVGFISAIPFGVSIIAVWCWARFVAGKSVTGKYVAAPLLLCALALASALYMPSVYLSLAVFAVGTSACFCAMVTFWQLPSRFLTGRAAAAGIAFITSVGVSAGVVVPYVIGRLRDETGNYGLAFVSVAACMLLAAMFVTYLESRIKVNNRQVPV